MRRLRIEQELLLWFGIGVVASTFLMNRLLESGLVNYQILYENLYQNWSQGPDNRDWMVWRIVLVRVVQTAVLVWLCRSRYWKAAIRILPLFLGMSMAVLLVFLTWNCGVSGLVCFAILGFPHGICYLAAWMLILFRYASRYEVRRGKFWSAVLTALLAGMLSEILINPWFLKFF